MRLMRLRAGDPPCTDWGMKRSQLPTGPCPALPTGVSNQRAGIGEHCAGRQILCHAVQTRANGEDIVKPSLRHSKRLVQRTALVNDEPGGCGDQGDKRGGNAHDKANDLPSSVAFGIVAFSHWQ